MQEMKSHAEEFAEIMRENMHVVKFDGKQIKGGNAGAISPNPLEALMTNFSFPPATHSANELFCKAHFYDVVAHKSDLRTLKDVAFSARDAIVGVYSYCLMANDNIAMVYCGPRGGKRIVWDFGGGV